MDRQKTFVKPPEKTELIVPPSKGEVWESLYRSSDKRLWGEEQKPEYSAYDRLVPSGPILDLGMGEGRHALYWAAQGREVKGVDISHTAVSRALEEARNAQLPLACTVYDLREVPIDKEKYALILCHMVFQFLKSSEVKTIAENIKEGLMPGGIVSISAFSKKDPSFERAQSMEEELQKPDLSSRPRTFFDPNDFRVLFSDLELLSLSETVSLDLGHGEPHYHGIIEYIGRK